MAFELAKYGCRVSLIVEGVAGLKLFTPMRHSERADED